MKALLKKLAGVRVKKNEALAAKKKQSKSKHGQNQHVVVTVSGHNEPVSNFRGSLTNCRDYNESQDEQSSFNNNLVDNDALMSDVFRNHGNCPNNIEGRVNTSNQNLPINITLPYHPTNLFTQQVKEKTVTSTKTRKARGQNKPKFATHHREKMIFTPAGQAVAPKKKVSKYNRFIGMIATDPFYLPINVKDFRTLRKLGLVEKAWLAVKATIDWGHDNNLSKEDRIKKTVEKKLDDRWRKYRHILHQENYLPFIGEPERFICEDGRADRGQYQLLVDIWDKDGYSQKRSAPNVINRQQLRMYHTTGTITFAQMRYERELEHPNEVLDRSTFFKLSHTSKSKNEELPKPVNEEAQRHFDMLDMLEKRECDAGKEMTSKLRDELFGEHFGPESHNRVRGYGIGVEWHDVPGILTKKKGFSHEVQELRVALQISNEKHEEAVLAVEQAKAEVSTMMEATKLKEQKFEEEINKINRQLSVVSPLARLFEGEDVQSLPQSTLLSLLSIISNAVHKEASDYPNMQTSDVNFVA